VTNAERGPGTRLRVENAEQVTDDDRRRLAYNAVATVPLLCSAFRVPRSAFEVVSG
jgi:hypothetical protein